MARLIFFALIIFYSCSNRNNAKAVAIIPGDSMMIKKTDTAIIRKDSSHAQSQITDSLDPDPDYFNKLTISRSDSSMWLTANMKLDHKIFGYEKPDIGSRKMILLSIFTSDVEGNPYKCPLGAYYQSSDMENMQLKYVRELGKFIEANVIRDHETKGKVYFEKKWTEFFE